MADPRSILVIRTGAIGDIVMASGVITALRSRYPGARIVWLLDEINADLLRHNPRLDHVYVWPRRAWRQLLKQRRYLQWWSEVAALVRALRRERFDLVLELQGLLKGAVWAGLSSGRRRIGVGSREGTWLWMHEVIPRDNSISPMMSKEYRQLMERLGCRPEDFRYDLVYAEADRLAMQEKLGALGVTGHYAVLCPFTTRPQKHWLEAEWIDLALRLIMQRGLRVLIAGGPGEAAEAQRWAELIGEGACALAGQTSLSMCAALIDAAALTIGVDTGLTHMASALGRPVVAIFGSTLPYTETGSPWTRVLYSGLPCVPCERHPVCDGAYSCMREHTAASVMAAASALLDDYGKNP